jgi:ribosomal-protein-alanine N-acetyltransferase
VSARPLPIARLVGPRVLVRTTSEHDSEEYVRYFKENAAHFAKWDSARDPSTLNEEWQRARLLQKEDERLAGRSVYLAMTPKTEPQRLIGTIQIRNVTPAPLFGCAIGYGIDARFEGQGLMREGVELTCRWCFDVLGLHRVEAGYSVKNERSARVLERLGFVKEGLQRANLLINGEWHDHVSTSLINDAWSPRA